MKTSDIILKIAEGLFFSAIYLGISYLTSYLCIYWNWEWGIKWCWFLVGCIVYSNLFEQEVNATVNVLGVILNIGLLIFCNIFGIEPQLWIYIVLNTIICLNIVTTCIKKH